MFLIWEYLETFVTKKIHWIYENKRPWLVSKVFLGNWVNLDLQMPFVVHMNEKKLA